MNRWDVQKKQSGQSLLVFLKDKLGEGVSGKQVKRLIDAGKCMLNGKSERFSSRLVGTGDIVEIESSQPIQKVQKATLDNLSILYEDGEIIALDKPAGIPSDSKELSTTLERRFGKAILLHRLDKDTTGVLLFARNEQAAHSIEAQFKNRQIKKTYLALVDGIPDKTSGIVENFLGKLHIYHGQAVWGEVPPEKGLAAKTLWKIAKKGSQVSLLLCEPETGRTHQIRVHLSGMGHPILGDKQYGRSFNCRYPANRSLLHASELILHHPKTNDVLTIHSPLPEDFKEALKALVGGYE